MDDNKAIQTIVKMYGEISKHKSESNEYDRKNFFEPCSEAIAYISVRLGETSVRQKDIKTRFKLKDNK